MYTGFTSCLCSCVCTHMECCIVLVNDINKKQPPFIHNITCYNNWCEQMYWSFAKSLCNMVPLNLCFIKIACDILHALHEAYLILHKPVSPR